jgi:pimeloyl-ACP methyl ester carboxylesterase
MPSIAAAPARAPTAAGISAQAAAVRRLSVLTACGASGEVLGETDRWAMIRASRLRGRPGTFLAGFARVLTDGVGWSVSSDEAGRGRNAMTHVPARADRGGNTREGSLAALRYRGRGPRLAHHAGRRMASVRVDRQVVSAVQAPASGAVSDRDGRPPGSGLARSPTREARRPAQRQQSRRHDPDGQAGIVELGDGRLLASRRWPGTGAPLVVLHGLFDCSLGWKHVAAATNRPCLAFDLPGFGRSGMPAKNRLADYAQDILCALEILGVDSFSLVGHSLGGAVAATLSEHARERAVSLTLLAPVGFGAVPLAQLLHRSAVGPLLRLGMPLALSNPLTAAGIYMAVVSHGHPPEPHLLARVIRRAFNTAPGAIAANDAIVAAGRDPQGFAHRPVRYEGPVSVLWGASDVLVPVSHADRVCEALPQAKVTVWEGMGHHPQRERPQQLNRYLSATTRPQASA